jgi:predicted metal-dependent peptidase
MLKLSETQGEETNPFYTMNISKTTRDNFDKASNGLLIKHPFFANGFLQHEVVFTTEVKTASTNGKVLKINPDYMDSLKHAQRVTLFAHETWHVYNLDHVRMNGRDLKQWNEAADFVANLALKDAGLEPFPHWLYDERFREMSVEQVYRLRQQDKQDKPSNGQGQAQQGQGKPQAGQGQPSQGNGSQGQQGQAEEQGEVMGEVEQAEDTSQAEEQAVKTVNQAKAIAKRMGKMPASLERAVENRSSNTDPREVLARFMTEQAQSDYSWHKQERQYIPHDLFAPALYNETLGKFVVAIDTSGSISAEEIQKSVAFILSCLDSLADYDSANTVTVIYCDASVQGVEELESGMKCKPCGGGGTDFKPPFDYVEKEQIAPAGLIYLTDGYCDSFPIAPSYPVIWGLFTSCAGFKPPFGETVELFNL